MGVGTDDAMVLEFGPSDADCRHSARYYGQASCYSFLPAAAELVDERWEWDSAPDGRVIKREVAIEALRTALGAK